MITIKDVFEDYRQQINSLYDTHETEAVTLWVIAEITGRSRAAVKAFSESELTAGQAQKAKEILVHLKTGRPVQYILGVTEFYGLPFKVNPSVLIPRPETEELVEWIISGERQKAKGIRFFGVRILDIGTGSGCIAISLKKNLPDAQVSALDIAERAIETAMENAILNDADVNFIQADILNLSAGIEISKSDIIVSNPPYVTPDDKKQMHSNVIDFEPHTALFVPGHDPLLFYRAIADFALLNLAPGGLLFFEINESFGPQTVELLILKGFINIELKKDMSGRDRMVKASLTQPSPKEKAL